MFAFRKEFPLMFRACDEQVFENLGQFLWQMQLLFKALQHYDVAVSTFKLLNISGVQHREIHGVIDMLWIN